MMKARKFALSTLAVAIIMSVSVSCKKDKKDNPTPRVISVIGAFKGDMTKMAPNSPKWNTEAKVMHKDITFTTFPWKELLKDSKTPEGIVNSLEKILKNISYKLSYTGKTNTGKNGIQMDIKTTPLNFELEKKKISVYTSVPEKGSYTEKDKKLKFVLSLDSVKLNNVKLDVLKTTKYAIELTKK